MRSRVISSSAPNGSSMSRIRGSNDSARAIATRCCMPPDSWYGMCFVNSPSSTRSSISFARFARQSRGLPRISSGSLTLSSTLRQSNSTGAWKTMP